MAATGDIAVGAVAVGGVAAEPDVPGGVAPGPTAPGSVGPGDACPGGVAARDGDVGGCFLVRDAAVVRLIVGGESAAGDDVPGPAEAAPVALGAVGLFCADDAPELAVIVVDGPAGAGSSEPGAVGAGVTADESEAAGMDAGVGVVEES